MAKKLTIFGPGGKKTVTKMPPTGSKGNPVKIVGPGADGGAGDGTGKKSAGKKIKGWFKELFKGKPEIVKQIDLLHPDIIEGLEKVFGSAMESLPEIKADLPAIDTTAMEQIAGQPAPTISPVDLPPIREGQQFDFAPIEAEARAGFEQKTIPGIAERFAGLGAQRSSGFAGQLGQAGSDLERQLASLKSQYGLQREGLDIQRGAQEQKRGFLGEQLGQQRATTEGALEGQRFGQFGQLAGLGMQQRGQVLDRRQLILALLGAGSNRPMQTQQTPATEGLFSPTNVMGMGKGLLQAALMAAI